MGANGLLSASDPAAVVREASVPSLGDRVVRRIAGVAPQAPPLATAMAVLGDGGRLSAAAAMAGVEPGEAGWVAHRLRLIEVLSTEDPFAFVHPVIRRSVYDGLSASGRDARHTAAGELLRGAGAPAEAVAAHLAMVTPRGSTAVATTLVQAGERALAQAAPDEAVRWFRRALKEEAPEPPAAMILAQMGMTEVVLRDRQAIPHLQEARERAEDLGLRTRIAVALGEILAQAGEWEAAMAIVAAAEEEVGDRDPELAAEVAAIQAVMAAHDPHRAEEFDRERPRYRELAMGEGWAAHALAALLACAAAHRGEGVEEVTALADRALESGRLLAQRGAGAWASAQLLGALIEDEAYDRALATCEQVAEAGRRDGSLVGLLTGLGYRAWVYARRGDLPSAEVDLKTAIDLAVATEMPMIIVTGFFLLQDAILERPSLDEMAALVEATALDPLFMTTWTGAMLLEVRGRLRLARLDRQGGIEDLRAVGRTAAALRIGPTLSSWRSALALALPAEKRDEAAALIAKELELGRATGLVRPPAIALRAAGILEDGERGIELLRESVTMFADSEERLEHARSLVELGAALRRLGRRAEARGELETGMELARRCGAERLTARAQEELRAAGGRPRRMARSGPDALTASEQRVARLVTRGATNMEVAQELYVSLKTVETHLSHVYAKLGLSGQGSRSRLAEALDSAEIAGAQRAPSAQR